MKQKNYFLKTALLALTMIAGTTMSWADGIKLVEWNFDGGYSNVGNVYTPNGGDWAQVSHWFSDGAPTVYPDLYIGTQTNYVATCNITNANGDKGNDRQWMFVKPDGSGEAKTFRVNPKKAANSVAFASESEYTTTTHYVYYQFTFPTTGFTNIKIEYACAFGGSAEKKLAAVVSTNGGSTWTHVGTLTTNTNWRTYNSVSLSMEGAANQSNVLVRLLIDGYTDNDNNNWNLDYFRVTGEYQLTVGSAAAATLVLPYESTIPSGVSAYTLVYEDAVVKATKVTGSTLAADTPVLINAEAGDYVFSPASTTVSTEASATSGALTGYYAPTSVAQGYVLQKQGDNLGFYPFKSTRSIKAYRAYLNVAPTSAHGLEILFDEGETTGIGEVNEVREVNEVKDNSIYDLQGRRVANGQKPKAKGLYIVNGRKVVIK